MSLFMLVDLLYEPHLKNRTKREILKLILSEADAYIGIEMYKLREKVKESFGKNGVNVLYSVVSRLKELGIIKIKTVRDEKTKQKIRVLVLTPNTFEWNIRKIVRSMKK